MPSPWFYQAQLTLLGVLHPPWRWLVASRWQIFVKLRAGWPPTCSLDFIAFVFVFSPQIGRSTERPQFSAGLLYCILQALLSSSIPSAARRGGASDARPSLDESVRTGRELGAICSDLSGSHMCICHGIASSPCFPCRLLCHLPRGLQPPLNFPYAPKRLSICVSVSKTSFEKDGASATFLFQVEWFRFPSIIQSHWVGSAMTTVTGLLVASPGLHQKGVQEARTGHFFISFLHFVHCFRVYLWFFLFTNFYLLILTNF